MSQIVQVEVFDKSLVEKNSRVSEAELSSMKKMHEEVSLAEVPGRIIARRIENFQLIYNSVVALFSGL